MRFGETKWDGCRATEPSCLVGTVLRSLAEVTPFANRRDVANLAYWVTGTEGSNPSLSAIRVVLFTYNLEMAQNPRVRRLVRSSVSGTFRKDREYASIWGPRDVGPSAVARLEGRLLLVRGGALGGFKFLHILRCQFRRIEDDGHLVDLAIEHRTGPDSRGHPPARRRCRW